MSAVSLPQLQWECWSMDRMCTHQGIWKHALSPHSSSQLLLRAWLEHSQALRSGRDVQEGRCGTTVKISCSTPGATHLPALIPRGSPAPQPLWRMFPPAGSVSSPHPHAQHTTLTGSAASPRLGQEEEKAARAAQGEL